MSDAKVNSAVQKTRSTSKKKKRPGYVTSFRSLQKTIRAAIKSNGALKKVVAQFMSIMPDEYKPVLITFGIPFYVQLADLTEYIYITNYDLSCLFEEMVSTRSSWKRKLYARLVVLTLYECADDFAFRSGKPLREQLEVILLPNFDVQRKTIHKEIVNFNNSHKAFLKRIRNSVIGHRDHNPESQLELIKSLKVSEIVRLGTEYFAWCGKVHNLLTLPIMNELVARLAHIKKKVEL